MTRPPAIPESSAPHSWIQRGINAVTRPHRVINWFLWKLYRERQALRQAEADRLAELNKPYPLITGLGATENGAPKALIAFVSNPFLSDYTAEFGRSHANYWLVQAMVDELGKQGFSVDVTEWRNRNVPSSDQYDIVFGQGPAFENCVRRGTRPCPKIYFGWGLYAGATENFVQERSRLVKERQGFNIHQPHPPDESPRFATEIWSLGTEYVFNSYRAICSAPVYELPNPIVEGVQPLQPGKNHEQARRNFMWMAAYGTLRRSLDVLLELFETMPEITLTVCGGIEHEKSFFAAYRKQLLETPNIRYIGWLDVASQKYHDVTHECSWLIYPSVSDGMPGSVVNAMAEGVLPIYTDGAGIDTGGHGIHLNEITHESLQAAVQRAAIVDPTELALASESVSRFAWSRYSQDAFREAFRRRLAETMSTMQPQE